MSVATFLQKVETDVLNFAQAEIAKGEAWLKSFTPVAEADLQAAWTAFQPEIMAAIAAVEQIGLQAIAQGTTFDKLGAAVAGVGAALATKGVTASKGVLATLIQQVVTSLGNSVAIASGQK